MWVGGLCASVTRGHFPLSVWDPYNECKRPARTGRPDVDEEEVQRVSDALDEVERIEDPEARVRAQSRVMAAQVKRNAKWRKEREEIVLRMRDDKVPYRQIASRLGCSLATVQDIVRGYRGSGTHRPRKAEGER